MNCCAKICNVTIFMKRFDETIDLKTSVLLSTFYRLKITLALYFCKKEKLNFYHFLWLVLVLFILSKLEKKKSISNKGTA
jgi:hypothetical protein